MASIIRIKRSSVSGNPGTLAAGELAYSALPDNGSNGGDRLYIGIGTETAGNAATHPVIGGKYFTDLMDHTPGTLTATSAILVDANKKVDDFYVDNLQLNGNDITSTNTNGNIYLTPNGAGSVVLDGQSWPQADGTAGYFLKTNGLGQLSWDVIPATSFNIAGDTGVDFFSGGQTLTFAGGTGLTSTISNNLVTFDVDSAVALRADTLYLGTTAVTLNRASANLALTGILSVAFPGSTSGTITVTPPAIAGTNTLTLPAATDTLVGRATTDTLTNKTISGASNSLSNIGNVSLVNSSVTIGTTAISLGSSSTVLVGLTSVTLSGATSGTVQVLPTAISGTTVLTLPASTGTLVSTGDTATVTNTMLAGSIANNKLTNSSVTIGTTAISLGSSSTAIVGLTSVTLSGATSGTVQLVPTAISGTTVLTLPATSGTLALTSQLTGGTVTGVTGTAPIVSSGGTAPAISINAATTSTAGSMSAADKTKLDGIASGATANTGTVTSVSVTTNNGISGTVANSGTTPAISLSIGALTNATSITMNGATSGTVQLIPTAISGTTVLTLPTTTGNLVSTGDTATVTNAMLAGSIANNKLTNSSVTIGSTAVSLGSTVTTFAGLTSVTSTTFVGALTGNASTATTLATSRNINGVAFNGSTDITVTAAAGTLTGTTLNSTVVSSSLTSLGTIATGVWQGTAVAVAYGGTGSSTGSITGTGALTFTSGGTNTNVNLVPNGTGTVDVGSKRITSVATPTSDTDAANKGYVDAVKTGLTVKDSVRLATTGALTVTYGNGSAGVGATLTNASTQTVLVVDSVPVVVGDRILVKDQAGALQNGIYTVSDIGSISTNWVLTRATDFDNNPSGEIGGGDFVFVQEGTTQADNGYVVTTNGTVTVGTTAIDWVQFSGAGQITAGDGLTKSGNTIQAVGTANRISVSADAIDISTSYVGQATITTLGTVATGTWSAVVIAGQYGGTGVNNSGKTITLGGNLTTSGAFATTLTATAATSVTLPTTGTLATLAGSETLTNKTLTSPVIGTIVNTGTLTLPTSTDTLVGRATTDTLTNKTLTSPVINNGSIDGTTVGSTTRASGAFTTLTSNGATTFTAGTASSTTGTGTVVVTGGVGISGSINVGVNITGAGAATSNLDGFNIDGGTY